MEIGGSRINPFEGNQNIFNKKDLSEQLNNGLQNNQNNFNQRDILKNQIQGNQNTLNPKETQQLRESEITKERPINDSVIISISKVEFSNQIPKDETSGIEIPESEKARRKYFYSGPEERKQYIAESEKIKHAVLNSYTEFKLFKEEQSKANPDLDLTGLDLYQDEEGNLKLTSSTLSEQELAKLEAKISTNEDLKDAMSDLHEGLALVTNRRHASWEGYKQENFVEVFAEDFAGTIKLNDLIENYNTKVDRYNFVDEESMDTTEERIMNSGIIWSSFVDALMGVSTKVDMLV